MGNRKYILISTIALYVMIAVVFLYTQIASTTYINKHSHVEDGPMHKLYDPFFWPFIVIVALAIIMLSTLSSLVFARRLQFGPYEQDVVNQFKINISAAVLMVVTLGVFIGIDKYTAHAITSWVIFALMGFALYFQTPLTFKIYKGKG